MSYLVSTDLDADLNADWSGWSVDGRRHREQKQRKPDDEQQYKQDHSTEAVLCQSVPRLTTWRR